MIANFDDFDRFSAGKNGDFLYVMIDNEPFFPQFLSQKLLQKSCNRPKGINDPIWRWFFAQNAQLISICIVVVRNSEFFLQSWFFFFTKKTTNVQNSCGRNIE
jgi:hypothetical protein